MKKLIYLLSILLLFVFTACEPEEIEEVVLIANIDLPIPSSWEYHYTYAGGDTLFISPEDSVIRRWDFIDTELLEFEYGPLDSYRNYSIIEHEPYDHLLFTQIGDSLERYQILSIQEEYLNLKTIFNWPDESGSYLTLRRVY